MMSKTQFLIMNLVALAIVGLIYQCSPASDPDFQRCMDKFISMGDDPQDAMRRCNRRP